MAEVAKSVSSLPKETMSLAQSVRICLKTIRSEAENGHSDAICGTLSIYHPDTKAFLESLGYLVDEAEHSRYTRVYWGGKYYRDPRKDEGYIPYEAPEGFYLNAI